MNQRAEPTATAGQAGTKAFRDILALQPVRQLNFVDWRAMQGPARHHPNCIGWTMIANEQELQTTLDRIAWFQQQLAHLRKTETNPINYRAAISGFLAEIDRMQLNVREYFSYLPADQVGTA
jgi:hypothetical protein